MDVVLRCRDQVETATVPPSMSRALKAADDEALEQILATWIEDGRWKGRRPGPDDRVDVALVPSRARAADDGADLDGPGVLGL
jgi:hypothetical protein